MTLHIFPIIKSEFLPFGISVMSDSLSEKGMLYARIQIKDTILHIITTHFQASYFGSSDSNWKLSIRARLEQMNELCNYIKNLKNEKNISNKDTFILCGDFNVDFHQFEKMKKA